MGVTSLRKPLDQRHYRYPIGATGVLKEIFEKAMQDGLTIKYISERLGVSKITVTAWRQGKYTPSYFMLCCLAETIGYEITLKEKSHG